METKLKTSYSYTKILLILSLLCILFGAFCCAVGDLMLPVVTALLATIYLFDLRNKKYFSIFVSAILIILNVASFILKISASLFALQSILIAFLLILFFEMKWEKSDASYILTIICGLFTVASAILLAMIEQGDYSFSAAFDLYSELLDKLRALFTDSAMQMYGDMFNAAGVKVTSEDFVMIFDAQINLIISYIIIGSFIIIGFTMKLFSAISSRLAEDNKPIIEWRFITSNIFAYFYIVLMFVSVFTSTQTGIFAIIVANLYNVFMAIYVYVGINVAISQLSQRMRPIFALLLIIFASLIFASLALQLLAVMGVLFTIRKNKEQGPIQQ